MDEQAKSAMAKMFAEQKNKIYPEGNEEKEIKLRVLHALRG
jgi:hypothetical protein